MNATLDTAGPGCGTNFNEDLSTCRVAAATAAKLLVFEDWVLWVGQHWLQQQHNSSSKMRSAVHVSASAFMICPDLSTQMCCHSCQWHSGTAAAASSAHLPVRLMRTSTLVFNPAATATYHLQPGIMRRPSLLADNCAAYANQPASQSAWLKHYKEPMTLASQRATMSRVEHQMAAAIGLQKIKRKRRKGNTSPFGTAVSLN